MQKRRKPLNLFNIFILVAMIGAAFYFERMIVPTIPPPGVMTPTPTRNPESYITEAEVLVGEGKLAQAVESYQAALQSNPSNIAAYITVARLQISLGRYLEAQTNAENALLLNSNNATAHALRGKALASQGDFLSGEAAINRSLEIDPNHALAHAYYAELLADQYFNGTGPFNVIDKMVEESRIARQLGEGTVEGHQARGYVLEALNQFPEAIAEYETAIRINNNIAGLQLALGRTYRKAQVYEKAFDPLNRASLLNPLDPEPLLHISRIYFETGDFNLAEQYAEQVVNLSPQTTAYHGYLGIVQYRNFKWPQALENLNYVVNGGLYQDEIVVEPLPLQSGRVVEYYHLYAFALLRLGRCNEAVPIFQQIVTGVPGDQTAVSNATEGLRQCAENLSNASPTAMPAETSVP